MLYIDDLTYRIGGRPLIENASARISDGRRIGLVGRNGAGKSTLFRLIVDELQPDGGSIRIRPKARIGMVSQEAPDGSESLLDTVLRADRERLQLLEEAETTNDPHRIAEVHIRLADIDAHSASARAAAILSGLGFDHEAQLSPVNSFSGGWRMRVALAAILFSKPDLLLLDEPTNHLDLEASLWLESYLRRYPGTVLMVSHDRDFLNRVADGIIHLEDRNLVTYSGNYDIFERTRRERLEQQSALANRQAAQRKRMQAFIDRFRAKATKARQAQSRLKALARMEPIVSIVEERTPDITFPKPATLSPPLIAIEHGEVGYSEAPPVLRGLDFRIDPDDRIALLGANGNGKSTLAKLLSGRLQPSGGAMTRSSKLRVGYFAQHQMDELVEGDTAFQHLVRKMKSAPDSRVRARLGLFGFSQERADIPAGDLSGGEKSRLLFALMSHDAPNILILDEPTNHLDVDAREALVQALNDFQGAVLIISHDRHLLELTADRLWLVAQGTVTPFDGDLDDYAQRLLDERRESRRTDSPRSDARSNRRDERRARAQEREKKATLRRTARQAAERQEKLTAEMARLERALADPAVYEGSNEELVSLMKRQSDVAQALAAAEEAWLAAEQQLEEALND